MEEKRAFILFTALTECKCGKIKVTGQVALLSVGSHFYPDYSLICHSCKYQVPVQMTLTYRWVPLPY